MIEARDLCFSYPDGRAALSQVSFSVATGESVGVVGPNGAGKTTLFLCLCGVFRPTTGSVTVAGIDSSNPAARKLLPSRLGVVFQNSDDQLFCSSVGDDVAFGPLNLGLPENEVQARVSESLGQVGMAGHEDRVPFNLSGGEKRRAAIAGVLATRPEIMLLDEPSIFLDPRGRRELIQLTNQLPGVRMVASHDLIFIRETCRRIIVMEAGQIVASGTTELLCDKELMERHGLDSV